jgi:hypothetical protein
LGEAALDLQIAINYFCALGPHRRYRVSRAELLSLFGAATPRANVLHVLTDTAELGHHAVLRVYVASANVGTCIKHLARMAEEFLGTPRLGEAVRAGEYGLAILAATPEAELRLRKATSACEALCDISLVVGLGPSAATLRICLAARKGASS